MEIVTDFLEKAHEVFKARGGAVGTYEDDAGRVCAMGAFSIVVGDKNPLLDPNLMKAADLLNEIAKTTYGNRIAVVNDEMGKDAVNHCYELAIKRAREEENHE